jgi:hypothetical protein
MKRLALLIGLVTLASCAIPVRIVAPASAPHKFAAAGGPSGVEYRYWQTNLPAITGNNATITLFDTTKGGTVLGAYAFLQRLMLTLQCDQAVTVTYQVQLSPSTTWMTAAGSNASTSFPASTVTEVDFLSQGQESRIQVVTGSTGPTTCADALALFFVRDLGQ